MSDKLKKLTEAILWAAAAVIATQLSDYFASKGLTEIAAALIALAAWLRRSPLISIVK
jgi:hypothetical protein